MLQSLLPLSLFVLSVTARAFNEDRARGLALSPRAACAQDNCYRAYTHSIDIASPFCSTYIQSTSTTTITPTVTISNGMTYSMAYMTNTVPPQTTNAQLSSRCNLDTTAAGQVATPLSLRLSSACTCISVVPNTVTVTALAPASTTSAAPPLCDGVPNPYTSPNGNNYAISCNGQSAMVGSELPEAHVGSFQACIDACSTTATCATVTYPEMPPYAFCHLYTAGTYNTATAGEGYSLQVARQI